MNLVLSKCRILELRVQANISNFCWPPMMRNKNEKRGRRERRSSSFQEELSDKIRGGGTGLIGGVRLLFRSLYILVIIKIALSATNTSTTINNARSPCLPMCDVSWLGTTPSRS